MRSPTYAVLFASLGLFAVGYRFVAAQDAYPSRTVTLTIGFAAGGNGDIITRIVAEGMTPRLGQPVIVEPRPGAGGNTASARHVNLPPDGYSLISLTGGHAVSGALYKSLPFDPVDDFQMISTFGYQSFMIAVRADNPIKTVADLIAAAKAAPGKLTYSSVGVGSTQHLAGEWFCALTGVKMTHVPYRSGSATMSDLLGGQIDVAFDTITVIEPQFRAGKAHVLGVTSGTRWWSTPDVAPVADAVPGYDVLHLGRHGGAEGAARAGPEAAQRGGWIRARRSGGGRPLAQDRRHGRKGELPRGDADHGRRPGRALEESGSRRQHPSAVSVSREWRRSRPRSQRCAVPFRYTCAHQPLALKPEHLVFSPQPEGSPEGYSRLLAG